MSNRLRVRWMFSRGTECASFSVRVFRVRFWIFCGWGRWRCLR